MCLFARASEISVDHHHAEKRDKKGIMKIERQREGIMIGLLLMEVWRQRQMDAEVSLSVFFSVHPLPLHSFSLSLSLFLPLSLFLLILFFVYSLSIKMPLFRTLAKTS